MAQQAAAGNRERAAKRRCGPTDTPSKRSIVRQQRCRCEKSHDGIGSNMKLVECVVVLITVPLGNAASGLGVLGLRGFVTGGEKDLGR